MQNKVVTINGKIEYAQNIAFEELTPPSLFEKDEELSLAIQELDLIKKDKVLCDKASLEKDLAVLQKEELEINIEIADLDKQLQIGKKTYNAMLSEKAACCPVCKQLLNDKSKIEAKKQYKNNLLDLFNKQTKLKERYKQKHFDKVACEGKIFSLEKSSNIVSPETIKALEEQISQLQKEKQEHIRLQNEYTTKLQAIQKAKNDIQDLEKEIVLLNNSIESTKKQSEIAKKLYFNSIKEKMSTADKYLKDVKIRYYTIVKGTGELKDDFVITYKDKDFALLSKSEKTAASLEIANMFNKIAGINSPLFIDDSESYPDFDFISMYKDTQIFIAQVQKGRNLKITNQKDEIKGCTTLKTLYNKKQLISVA